MSVRGTTSVKRFPIKGEDEFCKVITIDFSSLDHRFETLLARVEELEARVDAKATSEMPKAKDSQPTTANGQDAAAVSNNIHEDSSIQDRSNAITTAEIVRQLEELQAAQLRCNIDTQTLQSSFQLALAQLRREVDQLPHQSDLSVFRDEVEVSFQASFRSIRDQVTETAHELEKTQIEHQLEENEWKSTFENAIDTRIKDVWAWLQSSTQKFEQLVLSLQTDIIQQEENGKDVALSMEEMRTIAARIEHESISQGKVQEEQAKELKSINDSLFETNNRLDAQRDIANTTTAGVTKRLDAAEISLQRYHTTHESFVLNTNKSLESVSSNIKACQSDLLMQQAELNALGAGFTTQSKEITQLHSNQDKQDAFLSALDARNGVCEKKLITTASVIQEHHQEVQIHVKELRTALDKATKDRATMKKYSEDLGDSIVELRQSVQEVTKAASSTDTALKRACAEIPKLQNSLNNNLSNTAKNRQSIRDLTASYEDERKARNTLAARFEREVQNTASRFEASQIRDDKNEQEIKLAEENAEHTKNDFEKAIRYNSNMIHQLNTMVDSLVIPETPQSMEDKMKAFALSCAQLGLKLEFLTKSNPSAMTVPNESEQTNSISSQRDTKAELAMLLSKVVRFLGAGVAVDQNKYLLTAKRQHSADDATGAVVMEMPPQQVLEGFRVAKATLFATRTRQKMDSLQPISLTNKYTKEFRDSYERRIRFVLEFGLANLFPNAGKPRNPVAKRPPNSSTCIACDRPIDDDQLDLNQMERSNQLDKQEAGGQLPMSIVQRATPDGNESSEMHKNCLSSGAGRTEDHQSRYKTENREVDTTNPAPCSKLKPHRIQSSAVANRIDTTSAIRGKSGNTGMRPKSASENVHKAPGTAEFVYRGGFRLPVQGHRNPSQTNRQPQFTIDGYSTALSRTSSSPSIPGYQVGAVEESGGIIAEEDDSSSLERVQLIGQHQQVSISVPKFNGQMYRPQSAPQHSRSLPKLPDENT